jgi:hypothetical protein
MLNRPLGLVIATVLVAVMGISSVATAECGGGGGGTCPLPTKEPK